ncbi:MAG: DsbA family protein [Magnetovibrio sp.]|nr:DsbA family protein [Magnetovibrio sp.]
MNSAKSLIIASILLLSTPFAVSAEEAVGDGEKAKIEQVVRDYILNNPEIIAEAIVELQRREKVAEAQNQKAALSAISAELTSNPNDPVMGNPNGDVTVVEFFDYRCGFCKRVFDDVQMLMKEDPNVRYVLKEFPILGAESIYASRVAMAVWLHQKDKYGALHIALMNSKGALDQDKVLSLAKEAGVDTGALTAQMEDPTIDATFAATRAQAGALGLSGTPAFIVGENIAPGAIPLAGLKQLVAAARNK